jgi:hypothetical protein
MDYGILLYRLEEEVSGKMDAKGQIHIQDANSDITMQLAYHVLSAWSSQIPSDIIVELQTPIENIERGKNYAMPEIENFVHSYKKKNFEFNKALIDIMNNTNVLKAFEALTILHLAMCNMFEAGNSVAFRNAAKKIKIHKI